MSEESNIQWEDLNLFEQGYLECILTLSEEEELNFYDLTQDALMSMLKTTAKFQEDNWCKLSLTDLHQSGFDLYFDANGCGTGFLDREEASEEVKEALHKEAYKVMTSRLYLGEDGKIHIYENS